MCVHLCVSVIMYVLQLSTMAPSAAPVASSTPLPASAAVPVNVYTILVFFRFCLPARLRFFAFVLVLVSVYFRAHFQSVPFVFLNFFHTLSFCARRLLICTPQLPWPPWNATAAINYSSDIMLPLPLPLPLPLTALHSATATAAVSVAVRATVTATGTALPQLR